MLVPRPGGGRSDRDPPGSPWPCLPAGVGFAIGFAASVMVTMLARLLGAAGEPTAGLTLLAVTAATVGALTTPVAALGAAAQCWACYTGFLLHRWGALTFDHRSLPAACVLLLSGVIPSLLASAARGRVLALNMALRQASMLGYRQRGTAGANKRPGSGPAPAG